MQTHIERSAINIRATLGRPGCIVGTARGFRPPDRLFSDADPRKAALADLHDMRRANREPHGDVLDALAVHSHCALADLANRVARACYEPGAFQSLGQS